MPRERSLNDLFALIAGLLAVAYPLFIYWGLGHLAPRVLGAVVLGFFVLRAGLTLGFNPKELKPHLPLFVAMLVSCGVVILNNDERFLLFVPVFISLAFLAAIGQSLIWPPTFIERFARRDFPVMPPSAVRYCRHVTVAWCVFLLVNAGITLALALAAPLRWWAVYSGLLSYVAMGLLFVVEWIIRRFHVPRFERDMAALEAAGEDPA